MSREGGEMKLRHKVTIEATAPPTPVASPLQPHEQAAAYRAMNPQHSAHDEPGEAPCWACGGPCAPGSLHWGVWRLHAACEALRGSPAARLTACCRALARQISDEDARLVPFDPRPFAERHPEPVWTDEPTRDRLPWRHIEARALDAGLARLPELRVAAGLVETSCVTGRCAWCGVLEARTWSDRGHHWADGSPAPLCGSCARTYDAAGSPDPGWWDGQRAWLASALSGTPAMSGQTPPAGLLAFAEVEETGDGQPWGHLDPEAVESYRWAVWGRYNGAYAPPEHRQEALRRARAHDEAMAARMAARSAAEAARQDVFGFTRQEVAR
jgi:hypothetical protein